MKKFTALEAIRKFCLQCQGGVSANVTECQHTACPFYAYRMGVALPAGKHRPLKTIRTYCVEECQAGNQGQVDDCQGDTAAAGPCPAFPFRMGRNPNITKAQREKLRTAAFRRMGDGSMGLASFHPRANGSFQAAGSPESTRPEVV